MCVGKVEAGGLKPWTVYNYQFTVCGSSNSSPVGQTKTTPGEDADVEEIRFAVYSCSNYRKSQWLYIEPELCVDIGV